MTDDTNPNQRVLVLDLEGTLISSAVSQIPRPGLRAFLEACAELFHRIVVMTAVDEPRTRRILQMLAEEGSAPAWLAEIEYIEWDGEFKDLFFVPRVEDVNNLILLDDMPEYVAYGQQDLHVWISSFDPRKVRDDYGFPEVLQELRGRVLQHRVGYPTKATDDMPGV